MSAWVDVATTEELARRRRIVVADGDHEVLVMWHDGRPWALANRCIHKQRELSKGVLLKGKLVCPGHQWAFDLATGWEAVKRECQPVYAVRVDDGMVSVDLESASTMSR